MTSTSTSVGGDDPANDTKDHASDGLGNKTFGEQPDPVAPVDEAAPGTPNLRGQAAPDGPNVGPSPWEKGAAEGKLPNP